jgi:RimJ/RimL family protein N-acetyltransferase
MRVREVEPEEAEAFINLIKQVETESHFMLMEAGERKTTPEQQRQHIERIGQLSNSVIFVAEEEGQLVGYLMALGGNVKKTKHTAYLVIGIKEQYRGQGLGTALFQRIEEWANTKSILRLELTVVTKNEAGVALYTKMGFEIEGTKRQSLMIDGTLYNEYYMSKLL